MYHWWNLSGGIDSSVYCSSTVLRVILKEEYVMTCPKCGSTNVTIQAFQENRGSITTTKSKYKEKGHGCLWWIFIGSWWWIIDLLLWIFLFIPRILLHIGRKKKYKGTSRSITVNDIQYTNVCICQDCGHSWKK